MEAGGDDDWYSKRVNDTNVKMDTMNRFDKKKVLTVGASHTLHDVYTSFLAPLIPLLTEKLGFSLSMAGLLTVVQRLPSLFNPLLGLVADKLVIRWFLILSPLVSILSMGLVGVAHSVAMLAVLLFICGISSGVYHTTAPVIMKQVSGTKIGTGMSFFMFGGELARTIGPMIIIGAVSLWGLEGTWRVIPFGLVGVLILYSQLHTLPDVRRKTLHKDQSREPVKAALKKMKPLFFIIAPMLLFRAFSKTALTTFLPAYLVEDGYDPLKAGMVLALLEGIAAIATLASGALSDTIGRKKILVAIMLVSPVLMYLFTITEGAVRLSIVGLMGAFFFASTPVFLAMVHDLNSDYPALANGIFMSINFAMSSIVSILVGHWGDQYGLHHTYQLTALLTVGAIPFTFMIGSKDTK